MSRPYRKLLGTALGVCLLLGTAASPADATFGLLGGAEGISAKVSGLNGSSATLSGSHPYEASLHLGFKSAGAYADGDLRDLNITLPAGLLPNTAAVLECTAAQFHTPRVSPYQSSLSGESCPDESQVGVLGIKSSAAGGQARYFGLFNLASPPGAAGAIGASPFGVPLVFAMGMRPADAAIGLELADFPQEIDVQSLDLTLWGTPGGSPGNFTETMPWTEVSPGSFERRFERVFAHDGERGNCLNEEDPNAFFGQRGRYVITETQTPPAPPQSNVSYAPGTCAVLGPDPVKEPPHAYLSLPTSCQAPMSWGVSARSWQEPANELTAASTGATPSDCVEFRSKAKAQLRTDSAASATGFVFNIDINDGGGLLNEEGRITSPVQRSVVSLPEGLTINPSVGSGLGVCSEAQFALESAASAPGEGCPNNSKLGEVEVEGLLGVEGDPLRGDVFLATPYANPQHTLIALYITARDAERGLFLSSSGKIVPDPHSGRLVASFEDLPVAHYTHFTLSLREGQRAAMVSPSTCGAFDTDLALTPYSGPNTIVHDSSTLLINHGEGGGPCPSGSLRPFTPKLQAGSANAAAGAYSSFFLHMTRTDAEQEITSYSATFPKGLLGKIAGIPYCPEAVIAAAAAKSGTEELERPSCPAASSIGHTLAGYGVGGVLAYAPGGLYLAGPYHGSSLSVVAIDSALVGPFDLGVVIVRSAIRVDPHTAQASIDSAGSDPIPHILEGIPLHLRDIRVYVDRPNFTLNPTSCDVLQSRSTLTGAGSDVFGSGDDVPAAATDRFQVLGCQGLGFKPRFSLRLKGGTTRGRYPALTATYRPRPGQANTAKAIVTLPGSLFLAQEHLGTVCTTPQLQANRCPADSKLGTAKAISPLLDEPLTGNVYARSSSNQLPDILADIRGRGIEVQLQGKIDAGRDGGLRASFDLLPDAPVTSFQMKLAGGKHGLLVNSENLCASPQIADARFAAQSNASVIAKPKIKVRCKANKHKHKHKRKGRGR
jgi:hypothetical protein